MAGATISRHDLTEIADNRKVVTTAGTRVQLTAAMASIITITAETDNTGNIAVGGSTVVAATGSQRGAILGPGDSITLPVEQISDIYIDSTVSGDGVTYVYFTRRNA